MIMSPIRKRGLLAATILFIIITAGCGTQNSDAIFDPETGKHIGDWSVLDHKSAAQKDLTACISCHGENFTGGISGVSCRVCHINTDGTVSCSQCHGYPPATGAHADHRLPNLSCVDCHSNTVGTPNHDSGVVDVNINATYNANSGTATFSGVNCTNISCHGSPRTQSNPQAALDPPQSTPSPTPDWLTGTIDVMIDCTSCHVLGANLGSPENNSYYSGRHELHVYDRSIACTQCHDTAQLAVNHFSTLNTPELANPALTLVNAMNYNGNSCNPSQGGMTGCHGDENW